MVAGMQDLYISLCTFAIVARWDTNVAWINVIFSSKCRSTRLKAYNICRYWYLNSSQHHPSMLKLWKKLEWNFNLLSPWKGITKISGVWSETNTVQYLCSLSNFARKGSKRCRWGDICIGHDESSHSAPWRPLRIGVIGVIGVEPLMIGRQEDRYIYYRRYRRWNMNQFRMNHSTFPLFSHSCIHLAFVIWISRNFFPCKAPQILRRWSLDGVPETVLGGTFGGGYDQLKFPRGIMLQGGSALVWFVWS